MITTPEVSASANTSAAPTSSTQKNAATAASDFKNFLQLLTAQLRNQDPLSPLDSTQFVEQLASFSAVEQQIETNKWLEKLTSNLAASGLEGATPWIGKEVETVSGAARFQGEDIVFRVPQSDAAGPVEAVITDRGGNIVYQERLSAGQQDFVWNGQKNDSALAPIGEYAVSINYYENDELIDTKTPFVVTNVLEARLEGSKVKLVLENGAIVDPESILAVRDATDENSAATQS